MNQLQENKLDVKMNISVHTLSTVTVIRNENGQRYFYLQRDYTAYHKCK